MHRLIWLLIIIFSVYTLYNRLMSNHESEQQKLNLGNEPLSEEDLKNFDPNNMMVNMGGRLVPFSKINKPHNVVLDPKEHKPIPNAQDFPDLTPEAKARDAERDAAFAAKQQQGKAE